MMQKAFYLLVIPGDITLRYNCIFTCIHQKLRARTGVWGGGSLPSPVGLIIGREHKGAQYCYYRK